MKRHVTEDYKILIENDKLLENYCEENNIRLIFKNLAEKTLHFNLYKLRFELNNLKLEIRKVLKNNKILNFILKELFNV